MPVIVYRADIQGSSEVHYALMPGLFCVVKVGSKKQYMHDLIDGTRQYHLG